MGSELNRQRGLGGLAPAGLLVALLLASSGTLARAADTPAGVAKISAGDSNRFRLRQTDEFRLGAAFRPSGSVSSGLTGKPYAKEIGRAARNAGLDPALVHAVVEVESRHNARAVSPKGAIGLMQVMPDTGARFVGQGQLMQVDENLRAGTLYLRHLMDTFGPRLDLALAAYNAGEGAVTRHGNRIPPYAETKHYVPAVLGHYSKWKASAVPSPSLYLEGTRLDPAWREKVAARRARPSSEPSVAAESVQGPVAAD